jgi:hypothetical protein
MLEVPVSNHKGLYQVCKDNLEIVYLDTQEVASYKLLPLERHEETHSVHPTVADSNH